MIDLVVISLGAIVGANARYLLSRFAAKELGPVFPYGTLFINIAGSLIVGFFRNLDYGTSAGRSALATAGRCGLLRFVYYLLQLRI